MTVLKSRLFRKGIFNRFWNTFTR